jgi:hypothetical protein
MNAINQGRKGPPASHMGDNLSGQPITGQVPPTVYTHVLSRQQYKVLEQKALQGKQIRDDSTVVQVSYLAGIEHVLRLVREGFAVE